jgi:DNA-binding NtrC family response regulator
MIKLMIIDDEAQITNMLNKWFSKNKDFSISTYTNPEIGVNAVGSIKPDVVLLDIMMPQMDGIEALEKIKKLAPETVVIMMTAYSTLERVLNSHKQGASSYVLKPFDSLADVEAKVCKAYNKN